MPNLKIWINEKKYPTKIEFCCNEMAGAMCKRNTIIFFDFTHPHSDECLHKVVINRSRYIDRLSEPAISVCPFCKGDIELIEKED